MLSALVKHKQTSQEAALRASPMHRTAWGSSAKLQNQAYSKEVASLLTFSGVSILSLMAQSQTHTAKHNNKQRGFWAHQHLSCLFRAKMLKIPCLLLLHVSWSHESYCISPAFIWFCFWSHLTKAEYYRACPVQDCEQHLLLLGLLVDVLTDFRHY